MVTIKEVAKLADLSVSTVSRFLNNHPYVSDDKRERILKAMKELDYTPNPVATQLRTKKSNMIGILVSRMTNPYFSYLVNAIEIEAKSQGYFVLIMQTYDDNEEELRALELLKSNVISGLIMCSIESDASVIDPYEKYGPIVLCNETLSDSKLPQVNTNQEEASYEATKYLIEDGHENIAFCTGGSLDNGSHGEVRIRGFERALAESELIIRKEWIFSSKHTIDDGREVAKDIMKLDQNNRPSAVFANSDEVASGIIDYLKNRGKTVPDDLAVVGFDNQPISSMITTPITTVAQPVDALGETAIKLLIAKLKDEEYEVDYSKLKLEFIKRESA